MEAWRFFNLLVAFFICLIVSLVIMATNIDLVIPLFDGEDFYI